MFITFYDECSANLKLDRSVPGSRGVCWHAATPLGRARAGSNTKRLVFNRVHRIGRDLTLPSLLTAPAAVLAVAGRDCVDGPTHEYGAELDCKGFPCQCVCLNTPVARSNGSTSLRPMRIGDADEIYIYIYSYIYIYMNHIYI